jgi:hypothetical protein
MASVEPQATSGHTLWGLPQVPGWVLAVLYLLIASTVICLLRSKWAYDDPFITYRYADNLASGAGFVYNSGERILSTTTPLFTLILACIAVLWEDIPLAANLIGAISIAAGALLIFDMARSLQTPIVGWVGLFLYPTYPLLLDTIGSETPLFITLCLASFAFYYRSRHSWTALAAAAAVLARPDGLLVAGLLAADYLIRRRQAIFPLKSAGIFSLVLVAWILFAWIYFGSPVPATLYAKQHQGLMEISQRFPAGLAAIAANQVANGFGWFQAGLALIGAAFLLCCARKWMLILAWPLVIILAYTLLGVTTYFWYYAPLVPSFTILIGLGLTGISHFASSWIDRINVERAVSRFGMVVLIGVMVLLIASAQAFSAILQFQRTDPRYAIYRDLGLWLHQHTSPDALVGALEVGVIGYYSGRPMVDFAGLIQPEVAAYLGRDRTYQDSASFAINHFQPNYLILNSGSFQSLENSSALKYCRVVKRFQGKDYGYGSDVHVYACKEQ